MQSMKCDKHMAHDGKVGCNTIEYTMACLCSDWQYFLWHGKKNLGTTLGLRVKKLVSKFKKKHVNGKPSQSAILASKQFTNSGGLGTSPGYSTGCNNISSFLRLKYYFNVLSTVTWQRRGSQ